jgi:hypothetical protein
VLLCDEDVGAAVRVQSVPLLQDFAGAERLASFRGSESGAEGGGGDNAEVSLVSVTDSETDTFCVVGIGISVLGGGIGGRFRTRIILPLASLNRVSS